MIGPAQWAYNAIHFDECAVLAELINAPDDGPMKEGAVRPSCVCDAVSSKENTSIKFLS